MGQSNNPQIHVPRVWEVTGKAPEDRRRAVREWNDTYQRLKGAAGQQTRDHLRQQTRSR